MEQSEIFELLQEVSCLDPRNPRVEEIRRKLMDQIILSGKWRYLSDNAVEIVTNHRKVLFTNVFQDIMDNRPQFMPYHLSFFMALCADGFAPTNWELLDALPPPS